jgi:membrane-bound lytic murein transglycosylase F
MQVLPATANEMGFSDVTSPEQGIHAGVQYMDWLRQRFAENDLTIQDRTWFSLASYNAGLARVQRARRLAVELGLDPNRWFGNVEIAIRKISGCNCGQTVAYVSDIRNLYDAYVQMINSIRVAELRLNRSSYSS